MQLKRFKHFAQYLRKDTLGLVSIELFRFHEANWYDERDKVVEDSSLCKQLSASHTSDSFHGRARKSSTALMKIEPYNAVARTVFQAPPKKSSLDRVHERIEQARVHAGNAFDAVHDSLTGLLNGKGFTEAARAVAQLESKTDRADITPGVGPAASTMAILAMDIDHFKQVNDDFGHLHGDIVLQCLAQHLDDLATVFESESKDGLQVYTARPSGEEFLMLIAGNLDAEKLKSLAERVRTTIAEKTLSNDHLWARMAPPSSVSQRVTVSIGISSVSMPKLSKVDPIKDTLRNEADLALYSAKAGGRNTVRHFSELLLHHGHILQHHPETDIVAIDLGRQVGVPLGQEFRVFHPDFCGTTPFMRSDGRSSKKLGLYPRIEVGRIVVFDVQQDISFCRVASPRNLDRFPDGSHLEAIPIGSIAHLVSPTSFGGVAATLDLTPVDQLTNLIIQATDSPQFPVVAIFSVDGVDALIKARGTAFINESLAQLFAAMREILPSTTRIGQVQSTEFAALAYVDRVNAPDIVRQTVNHASQKCKQLATFSAGIFLEPSETDKPIDGDKSILERKYAIEYARYAASDARRKGNEVTVFAPKVAKTIMHTSYSKQLYRQAIEDCKVFRALGIHNGEIENLAAICAFALGLSEKDFILDAGRKAVDIAPDRGGYWANLGIYEYYFDEPLAAHKSFQNTYGCTPEYVPRFDFRRVIAMAAYAEFIAHGGIAREDLLTMLTAAREPDEAAFGITPDDVDAAISVVRGTPSSPIAAASAGVPIQPSSQTGDKPTAEIGKPST